MHSSRLQHLVWKLTWTYVRFERRKLMPKKISINGKFIYYELNATVLEEILLWINELKGEKNYDQTK